MSGFILQAVSADDPGYWAHWDGFDQGIGPDRVVLVEGGMGVVEIASSSGRQRTGSLSPRLWVCLAWPLVRSGQIQVLVSVWFPELGRVPYFWLLGWVPDTVWFNWCVPADCFFFCWSSSLTLCGLFRCLIRCGLLHFGAYFWFLWRKLCLSRSTSWSGWNGCGWLGLLACSVMQVVASLLLWWAMSCARSSQRIMSLVAKSIENRKSHDNVKEWFN